MPTPSTLTVSLVIGEVTYQQQVNNVSDVKVEASPIVPAAKVGSLTTRTNDTSGTLTMNAGHGFTTGATIDLFWTGGSRRGITVGTVSTNSVPISSGTGDVLPAAATGITAMVPLEEPMTFVGDNIEALGSKCPVSGWVSFLGSDNTVHLAHQILPNTGGGRLWAAGQTGGGSNPVAGDTVTKVLFSHDDATQAQTMYAVAVY